MTFTQSEAQKKLIFFLQQEASSSVYFLEAGQSKQVVRNVVH